MCSLYNEENWATKIDKYILQNSKNLRLEFDLDLSFEGTHVYMDSKRQKVFNMNRETYRNVYKLIKENFLFMFRFPCTIYFYKGEATVKFIIFSAADFVAEEKEISTFPETIQRYFQSSIQIEKPSNLIFPYLRHLEQEREESFKDEIYFLDVDDELDYSNMSSMNYKDQVDLKMIESLVLLLSPYDYGWQ